MVAIKPITTGITITNTVTAQMITVCKNNMKYNSNYPQMNILTLFEDGGAEPSYRGLCAGQYNPIQEHFIVAYLRFGNA